SPPSPLCDDDERWRRLMAWGRTEMAEAWLAALVIEARRCERPLRDDTLRLSVWLWLGQRRYEEAQRACREIAHPGVRRALSRIVGSACRRPPVVDRSQGHVQAGAACPTNTWPASHGVFRMYLLHAVPSLL